MDMSIIQQMITTGMEILNKTREQYDKDYQPVYEKYNAMQVLNSLNGDEDKTRLKNTVMKYKSYVEYIDFIIQEFQSIKFGVLMENKPDFQYGCMYFGSGTLYYSDEFVNYSEIEQFEIVLNHIIHYVGALYCLSDDTYIELRLSYIAASLKLCLGEKINLSKKKQIYPLIKNNFDHIIFDISQSYHNFILNNKSKINSIKEYQSRTYTTIIQLNNKISVNFAVIDTNKFNIIRVDDLNNSTSNAINELATAFNITDDIAMLG